VPIPGIFTVYNVLNALGMALLLDLPLEKAIASLCTFKGVKGRLELVPTLEKQYQIFIDYAHTPAGLEKALLSARSFSRGRVIVIFGCGGCRDVYKRPIMGKIGTDLADFAIITSDNPRLEEPKKIISQIVSGIDKDK
jgi:UDP-N-acetylmuramoyl-L-alanyl-D-glutamate--2,6-diaminopimelate ligase